MKIVTGDLIALTKQGHFDVLVHGCNCFCTMGSGMAKAVRAEFPAAFAADQQTEAGNRAKLGNYSQASIHLDNVEFTVVNAYTQFDWRGQSVKADYDAIAQVFAKIGQEFPKARIGYPLIGAGLAGGDWTRISALIETALAGLDHTLVRLPE